MMDIKLTKNEEKLINTIAAKRNVSVETILLTEGIRNVILNELNMYFGDLARAGNYPQDLVDGFVATYSVATSAI